MANFTKLVLLMACCTLGWATTQAQDIIMGTTASPVNNACGRNFFDGGGVSGNYADSPISGGGTDTKTLTLCPAEVGQAIMVNFTKFDVAPGDRLVAFAGRTATPGNELGLDANQDGISDIGTLPATGAGAGFGASVSNAPGGGWVQVPSFCQNSNAAGCITFQFTRNGDNVKGAGWEANVTCVGSPSVTIRCRNNEFVNNVFISTDCESAEVRLPIPQFSVCGAAIPATYSVNCNEITGFGGTVQATGTGFLTGNFPVGNFTVRFQGNPPAGVTGNFVCEYNFRIFPNSMACNDLIRVSLNTACSSTITPEMLLENSCPNATYKVELPQAVANNAQQAAANHLPLITGYTPQGYPIIDFSYAHCNTEYDVTIKRTVNVGCGADMVDVCWGKVKIEDKVPPVFIDGPDVTAIPCYDDKDLLAKLNARRSNGTRVIDITGGTIVGPVSGDTYTIPGLTPQGNGYAEVVENCTYTVDVSDFIKVNADCSIDNLGPYQCWNLAQLNLVNSISSIFTFYRRTFTVTDKCGNKDTYDQLVAVVQPDIVAPAPQFEVSCTVDINPNALRQAWLDWVAAGKPANDPRRFYGAYIPNFDKTHLNLQQALAQYGIQLPPVTDAIITDASGDEIPASIEHADCGYAIDYQDGNRIETCGGGYKVFRDWTVFNWCDGHLEVIDVIPQVIIVKPTTPSLQSEITYQVGGGGYYECTASVTFNRPTISGGCVGYETSINVTIEIGGVRKTFVGTQPLRFDNVTIGQTVTAIVYASNGCQSEIEVGRKTITVEDNIPPQAICEQSHVVSLGPDCVAKVPAQAFDDGSYDNCGVITFKVARMDALVDRQNLANAANDQIFKEFVEFTASDLTDCLSNNTTVVLKVKDGRGNVNFCMSQVTVQDKLPPVCESQNFSFSCPDDIVDDLIAAKLANNRTQALSDLLFSGNLGGLPLAFDNCTTPTIEVTSSNFGTFDETCREGYITYRYRAVDACGNRSAECTGRIDVTPVSDWSMTFPLDYEIQCTPSSGASYPRPAKINEILSNNGCDFWGMRVDSSTFTAVDGACFKIVREYHLINWCTWDPSNTEDAVVERPADLLLNNNQRVNLRYRDADNNGVNDIDDRDDGDAYNATNLAYDGDFVLIDFADSPHGGVPAYTAVSQFTGVQERYVSAQAYGNIIYRQIIKVNDQTAPVITPADSLTFCGGDVEPAVGSACTAMVDVRFTASDACTPVGGLNVSYKLRPFGGVTAVTDTYGTLANISGNQYAIRGRYPIGPNGVAQHVLEIRATDGCGNVTTKEITFTVKDCKAPTAYCIFGLSVDLMPTGEVELWASDFDAGSFDFCTPKDELKLTFADPRIYPDSINRWFRCADGEIGTVAVNLWAQDKAGNVSTCQTFVVVQPNQPGTNCPTPGARAITGALQTETNLGVQNVELHLSGDMSTMVMSSAQGTYSLSGVTLGNDYTITPKKNDDVKNGVSTFDLVLLSKHILQVQLLDSPYKLIAADVNKSKNISTIDLVQLRKLILEIDNTFPSNTSWRFIPKTYNFPDPTNPWAENFPEVKSLNDLTEEQLKVDFMAIKIGDLNGSAEADFSNPQGRSTMGEMVLNVKEEAVKAGNTYTVDFTAADFAQIEGYQFTLNFNRNALALVDLKEGVAKAENFGMTRVDEGIITTSWNGAANADEVLFSLVFEAKTDAQLSDLLTVNSRYTVAEAYNKGGDLLDVALNFSGVAAKADGFELYQNQPNPFKGETLIGFNLPKAAEATLTVHDVSGKVLKLVRGTFAKGINQISLNSKELPQSGVLYYTLSTEGHTATKKMVIIE